MSCVEQKTKRYVSRKSPPYKAEACKSQTRVGNDGSKYISTQITNGSWRWYPIKNESKKPMKKEKPVKKEAPTGCVKQTTKRFTARKSPPFKAENCQGKVRVGNDNEKYISTQISNGSWRWYLVKKPTKSPAKKSVAKSPAKKPVAKTPAKKSKVKSPEPTGCVKQTTKRFTARKSPPFKAENCQGKVREGNDGEKYISTQISNGSWRWVKKSPPKAKSPPKTKAPSERKMYTSSKGTYYVKYDGGKTERVYTSLKPVKKVTFKPSDTTSSDGSCNV